MARSNLMRQNPHTTEEMNVSVWYSKALDHCIAQMDSRQFSEIWATLNSQGVAKTLGFYVLVENCI